MVFMLFIVVNFFLFQNLVGHKFNLSSRHEQVHLSLAKNTRTIVVSWTTFFNFSSSNKKPLVKFGIKKKCLNRVRHGKTTSLMEPKNSKIIRYFHRVYLKNLQYNRKYYYKVGDGKTWSKRFYFRTFPRGSNFNFKFCVFGDMDTGKKYTINELTKAVKHRTCDMVIHVGDIAYQLQKDDGFVGDEFMRSIEPIAAYIPYMVIIGNHEFDCNGFSHYQHRFLMPLDNNNVEKIDHFYSFNVGMINFVALSSEVYGYFTIYGSKPIQRQIKWLDKTLKKINTLRKIRPWTLSYFHRPIYCWHRIIKDECNEYESSTMRIGYKEIPGLENYFYKNGVDLILYGHEHGYQRYYPIYNRTVYKYYNNVYYNPPAPTYILTGAGGCKRCTPAIYEESAELLFSAKRTIEVGFTQIHVINHTHIKVVQVDAEHKKIKDSFFIVKDIGFDMYNSKSKKCPKGEYKIYNGPQKYQYLEMPKFLKKCFNHYNNSLFNNKQN